MLGSSIPYQCISCRGEGALPSSALLEAGSRSPPRDGFPVLAFGHGLRLLSPGGTRPRPTYPAGQRFELQLRVASRRCELVACVVLRLWEVLNQGPHDGPSVVPSPPFSVEHIHLLRAIGGAFDEVRVLGSGSTAHTLLEAQVQGRVQLAPPRGQNHLHLQASLCAIGLSSPSCFAP